MSGNDADISPVDLESVAADIRKKSICLEASESSRAIEARQSSLRSSGKHLLTGLNLIVRGRRCIDSNQAWAKFWFRFGLQLDTTLCLAE